MFADTLPPHVHFRDAPLNGGTLSQLDGDDAVMTYAHQSQALPLEYSLFPYSSTAHAAATRISQAWRALIRRRRRAVTLFQVRIGSMCVCGSYDLIHLFQLTELYFLPYIHAC